MKPRVFILSVMTTVLLIPGLRSRAAAFTPGACREDAQKFCGEVAPDGKKDCMQQHEGEFSQACKDNLAEGKQKMQQKMQEIREACQQDLKHYCANVTPGEG